ncbi:MAG: hypothetical protein ACFFFO_14355 [Candidatus Thorarchaeota archaeon]
MNNGIKASFVLGAIGGFLIALIYSPSFLGWTFETHEEFFPWGPVQHYQILILAMILISIGFFGLWRKSGNVIPLVSAICIIVRDITTPLPYYLIGLPAIIPDWLQTSILVGWIFYSVGWIAAGISAWLLREEFSPFSIVAALVFLAFGVANWSVALIGGGWNIWNSLLAAVNGIVVTIYFLDAART